MESGLFMCIKHSSFINFNKHPHIFRWKCQFLFIGIWYGILWMKQIKHYIYCQFIISKPLNSSDFNIIII